MKNNFLTPITTDLFDPFYPLFSELWEAPIRRRFNESRYEVDEDNYKISVPVPGIKKEDLSLNFLNSILTIQCKQGTKNRYQDFVKEFKVPTSVDVEKIEATCENGLLEITLPKAQGAKSRQIVIK